MRTSSRSAAFIVLLVALSLLVGCSGAGSNPCGHLVYKEGGLTREEYLPCAGQMLAAMDAIDEARAKVQKGDVGARFKMAGEYQRLSGMIRSAGGRNLLERWDDESLTRLNVSLWNAYTHYQAIMLIPNDADADAATRNKDEARSLYDELR